MARCWYLIRTKPQCDFLAADALKRDGFELFSPRVRIPHRRGGKRDAPLFPGYLFVRFDVENSDWPVVRLLPGILGWVRFDGVMPAVPDEVVNSLAERVEAIDSGGGLWNRFRQGDKVRVMSGKMESLAEVLEEATSPQARVRVLLEFMGRMVTAQVPWHDLHAAQQDSTSIQNRRWPRRTRGKGRWIRGFGPSATAGA